MIELELKRLRTFSQDVVYLEKRQRYAEECLLILFYFEIKREGKENEDKTEFLILLSTSISHCSSFFRVYL